MVSLGVRLVELDGVARTSLGSIQKGYVGRKESIKKREGCMNFVVLSRQTSRAHGEQIEHD
jgi:hypothetical protein